MSSGTSSGAHRAVVTALNGARICIDLRDESVCLPLQRSGEWEAHMERFYRSVLGPDSLVIDVGANVGYHTAAFAQVAARVLSVEANPDVAELLRCTVAENGFTNVTLAQNAIMDTPQTVEIFAARENLGGGAVARPSWYVDPNMDAHARHAVHAVTLDMLAADWPRVDLIHMDIEGCELPALRGARELLARSPNVMIIMEWGAHWAPAYGDIEEHLDALIADGFGFAKLEQDSSLTPQSRAQMLQREFCDMVASRGIGMPAS